MGPKMFTMAFFLPHSLCKLKYYRKQDSVLFIMKPLKMYLGTTPLTTITLWHCNQTESSFLSWSSPRPLRERSQFSAWYRKYTFRPLQIYTSVHFNRTVYLKGQPYRSLVYKSHLIGIRGSFLASITYFLKDRKAKSMWLTFVGTWPVLLSSWQEAVMSSNFQSKGRPSSANREDTALGRKGHGVRVTTGWGFSFPFIRSPRTFNRVYQAPSKVAAAQHPLGYSSFMFRSLAFPLKILIWAAWE